MSEFEKIMRRLSAELDHVSYTDDSLSESEKDTIWEIYKLVEDR